MAAEKTSRPLADKLGLKPGTRAIVVGAPAEFWKALEPLPDAVSVRRSLGTTAPYVHCFAASRAALSRRFAALKRALKPHGALWVSWPKQGSGKATDLQENIVRDIGLAHGLVDVKVCAIDTTWSGLKFVYRLRDRAGIKP